MASFPFSIDCLLNQRETWSKAVVTLLFFSNLSQQIGNMLKVKSQIILGREKYNVFPYMFSSQMFFIV